MKSVYLEKGGEMYIKEIDPPVPAPGRAIVKIHMCGICGTDLHSYTGSNQNTIYPLVVGHEAVGVITQIEENPRGLKVGDRVVLEPYTSCGKCLACSMGRYNCCERLRTCGVHIPGMMTEYVSHEIKLIHRIPDHVTDRQACMIEPFTIGIQATRRVELKTGETCAIFGAGAIGLICALIARAYGGTPILFDPVDERLEKARQMGFTHVFNNVKGDAAAYLREQTEGGMATVIYECSGAKPVLEKLHDMVSVCGRIVLVGWPHVPYSNIDTANLTRKELNVYGSRNSSGCFPEAIELIAGGKIDADMFITSEVELEGAKQVFDDMIARPGDFMKVLIKV